MGNKATETGLTRAGRCVTVDWMAHVAFVFIVCALLALKWPVFGGRNIVLVMIGALLPDIFKLILPLRLIGVNAEDALMLFHLPVGTLLVCGLCALLFEAGMRKRVFLLFAFGMMMHYALDVLLISVTGGLVLLYPLSWETWQLDLIRPNNWLGTTILVGAAALVWCVLRVWNRAGREIADERTGDA